MESNLSRPIIRRSDPVGWEHLLPPLGKRVVVPPEQWLSIWVRVRSKQCYCIVRVAPASDPLLRRKVIERLVADPKEFGLPSIFKKVELIGNNWASLGRINIEQWDEEEGPDVE